MPLKKGMTQSHIKMKREDNKPHVFIIVFFFYSRLQKKHRKLIDIYKIAHAIEGIFRHRVKLLEYPIFRVYALLVTKF